MGDLQRLNSFGDQTRRTRLGAGLARPCSSFGRPGGPPPTMPESGTATLSVRRVVLYVLLLKSVLSGILYCTVPCGRGRGTWRRMQIPGCGKSRDWPMLCDVGCRSRQSGDCPWLAGKRAAASRPGQRRRGQQLQGRQCRNPAASRWLGRRNSLTKASPAFRLAWSSPTSAQIRPLSQHRRTARLSPNINTHAAPRNISTKHSPSAAINA